VSKRAGADEQGAVIGLKEGMSSLARIFGPFCGLLAFGLKPELPFYVATFSVLILAFIWIAKEDPTRAEQTSI
jgi:hypothetical protein